MLEFLRKRASGFFSKLILGVIALIFVLYFGFTGGGPPQGGTAPIAKVNGQAIPSGLYFQTVQNQTALYQQLGQNISGDMQKMLESQVLQRLISEVLFSQEARKMGLRITDAELANAIRNNPNFQRNGQFDEQFYLKQFKPYYQRQNGQDYEYGLREQMLQERFRALLDQANVLSQQHVNDALLIQETQLNVRKLEIPFTQAPGGKTESQATELANQWIQMIKSGENTTKWVEQQGLNQTETGLKPLRVIENSLGGAESLPLLSCLVELQPGQVCEQPQSLGANVVAIQLLEGKSESPQDAARERTREQLHRANQNQILTGISNLLVQKAKVETFLNER